MVAVAGGDILYMTKLSRRNLLQFSGSALISLLAGRTLRAQSAAGGIPVKMSLMHEFFKKQTLDISPDGSKLCLENWGDARYPLEVVEIGTGKMIFKEVFQTRVGQASFFANSKSLLANTLIKLNNKIAHHLTVVDLLTGERTESQHFAGNTNGNDPSIALSDGIILVKDIDWKSIEKSSLILAEFPTYREVAKIPLVAKSDEPEKSAIDNYRSGVSNDRSIFFYSYGRTLVCRRTRDLEVLWLREIEPPSTAKLFASPNANYVAVAIADTAFRDLQKESYIVICNGKTGADVKRLQICGTEGLALSPDGNLLAVVEIINSRENKTYFAKVHVYDVKSGEILASFEHDRIKWQRGGTIKAACLVYFTADGQYLISSGMNTKVWKLIRNQG